MASVAPSTTSLRYAADALIAFGHALLRKSGVRDDIARDVATVLVEGDLLGHNTHGLALLSGYLAEIDKGAMAKTGEPTIVTARAATQAWDGNRLPGPWLTLRALDAAMAMADACGTGSVVIRRSHHIACLAAYLRRVTDRGRMALDLLFGPGDAQRGAVRRRVVRIHAQSVRRRHPDVGRSDPAGHFRELHDQWHDCPAAQGGGEAAPSVGAGRAGQRDDRSRRAVQRTEGHAAAARRTGRRTQGLCAGAAGRGDDRRTRRLRPRRSR